MLFQFMNQSIFLTDRMHFYASVLQMLRGLKGEKYKNLKTEKQAEILFYVTSSGFYKSKQFS